MRRLTALGIIGTTTLLAASVAAPASAAFRYDVELVNDQSFAGAGTPFTLNVDGCETGFSVDLRGQAKLGPGVGVFHGIRRFECAGGAGSVTLNVSARFGEGGSVGTWAIVGSDGVLAGAYGAGKLAGTPIPDGIRDVYTGTVTVLG
jgi:hypothetical protein